MARRDTRELILTTALALFNEQGEPNVSTNLIALEADISPGNLYYHFRHKEDLALELFKRYLVELEPLLEQGEAARPSLDDLHLRLHLLFETMERYRFVFRNLADLAARIPNLRAAMRGLMARQAGTLASVVDRLRQAGMMVISSTASAQLVHNLMLQMTYWIPFAEVRGEAGLHDGRSSAHAVARALYLVMPYLASSEQAQFEAAAREYLNA